MQTLNAGPDKERVPEAGDEVPPRQEPGQRGGLGEVQGGLHSLRRSLRPQQGMKHMKSVAQDIGYSSLCPSEKNDKFATSLAWLRHATRVNY